MATVKSPASLERNVRLYPWYAVCFNALFWYPVFFLFFKERLDISQALLLEAIYYFAVPTFEVPSGYFSDRVGRKPTLLISALALLAAYLLFFFGSTFAVFALAQVFLAAGMAFNSGTDASFHYDSLSAIGRESEYAPREAVVAQRSFVSTAVAALAGGAVALIDLRWAYGLSALVAAASVMIVLKMKEPHSEGNSASGAGTFVLQVRTCLGYLRNPALLWLFGFALLMTVLNHTPYEFYQPYIQLVADGAGSEPVGRWMTGSTPLVSGIHTAVTMLIASWFAGQSIRLRDRLGVENALLTSGALQLLIIGSMALFLHPIIVPLLLLRSVPRALLAAPLNAAIAPRVPKGQRATFLSLQSLAGRLSFAAVLFGLAHVSRGEGSAWEKLSGSLSICTAIAVVGLLFLLATKRVVKRDSVRPA